MAYQDIGFDEFLNRVEDTPQGIAGLSSADLDATLQEISGSKISGGLIGSPDNRMNMDLDQGFFSINDGNQDLVTLGVLPDGSVGLQIKDSLGNILMNISSNNMFLQSSDKAMLLDFLKTEFSLSDEAANKVVFIGKIINGF